MKLEMAKGHEKLVETNRVILKNNDILKNKLKKAKHTITKQMKDMDKQSDLIARLAFTMETIEQHYSKLETKQTLEFATSLFHNLFNDIKEKISEKFTDMSNELVDKMLKENMGTLTMESTFSRMFA